MEQDEGATGPAIRTCVVDLEMTREGWLAAAARLDALGVEVLIQLEASGARERAVRLKYLVQLAPAEGEAGEAEMPFDSLRALRAAARARFGSARARIVRLSCGTPTTI